MEELLSLIDLLLLLILDDPLLDLLLEYVTSSLDVIGQQPDDRQFVLRRDRVGINLIHLDN